MEDLVDNENQRAQIFIQYVDSNINEDNGYYYLKANIAKNDSINGLSVTINKN